MPLRMTKQRAAVAAALKTTDRFVSASDIHEHLAAAGNGIGLATVYRALQALVDAHEVDVLNTADGGSLYRQCERSEHHHHLVCRSCGTTIEIDGPAVEAWADMVGTSHGFTKISHTIELWGQCPACTTSPAGN